MIKGKREARAREGKELRGESEGRVVQRYGR